MTPLLLQRSKDADFKVHLAANISLYFMKEALLGPALYSIHFTSSDSHGIVQGIDSQYQR